MVAPRDTSKRTGASRRRKRVEVGQTRATSRIGLRGRTIPVRCECGHRLARVSVTAPEGDPRVWWHSGHLEWMPYGAAVPGMYDGWSTLLDKRNREGIAGELHLEHLWEVECQRCSRTRAGSTTQLVALILRARESRAPEVRISEVSLGSVANADPAEILSRWRRG